MPTGLSAIADTHTLIWYFFASPKLSENAKRKIEDAALAGTYIGVSVISLAEIVYLSEKKRIPENACQFIMNYFVADASLFVALPLEVRIIEKMATAIPRSEIPDFPDRLIAATASSYNVPLITKDALIKAASVKTIW